MENKLTQQQVKTILENAPKGTDQRKIIEGLVSRGYTLEGLNDTPVEQKPQGDTGLLGKAKAFTGGVAEGLGADLPLMAIQKAGEFAVKKIPTEEQIPSLSAVLPSQQTKEQMQQNLAQAKPLTEQFEDITEQDVNPITSKIGTAAGFVSGVVPAIAGIKSVPVVAKAVEAKKAKDTATFVKELITPELTAKATSEAIKTGKVAEAGLKGTRDITQAMPFFDDMAKAVSEVKGISPKKTLLENANAIHGQIGTVADDLMKQLKAVETQVGKSRGYFSPNEFKAYMNGVKETIKGNPTIVGDAETTASKILNKFSSLVAENGHTPSGLLKARKGLDSWMKLQKGSKVFDPNTENAVSFALKAIRQGGNDFLQSRVPDVAVKEMLSKQTSLYNAIENIAPKAAKEGANAFQRWVKANPKTIGLLKVAGGGVVGGGTAATLLNQ